MLGASQLLNIGSDMTRRSSGPDRNPINDNRRWRNLVKKLCWKFSTEENSHVVCSEQIQRSKSVSDAKPVLRGGGGAEPGSIPRQS